jgi:crotonobetainyl-CoA:carnitine CoA-transferase CaiB-like acyl-CoA transferase
VLAKTDRRQRCAGRQFPAGVLARIGFNKAGLQGLNPDLVCRHIKDFGTAGPIATELRDQSDFRRRVGNRREMNAATERRLETAARNHWIEKLNAAGVPCDR